MTPVTFEISYRIRGRKNVKRPDEKLHVADLIIGARGSADVMLHDRLVAGRALRLRPAEGALEIEVLDLHSGAFVDGHPVEDGGRFRPGQVLQIGESLLEYTMEEGAFRVVVNEEYLEGSVQKLTKKAATLEHDGPQEAEWGKHPRFAMLNVSMALLGLLAIVAFPFMTSSELLSRGPISRAHHDAFGNPLDCSACHEAFGSDYDAACIGCHEGKQPRDGHHPYASQNPDQADRRSCVVCHTEHVGHDVSLVPKVWSGDLPARGTFSIEEIDPAPACRGCHPDRLPEPRATAPADLRELDRPHRMTLDGFSHRTHLAARPDGRPMACADCHVRGESSDWAAVTYDTCLKCHGDRDVAALEGSVFTVHGRDETACTSCHASMDSPDLRTASVLVHDVTYAFAPKSHAEFLSTECQTCHVTGRIHGALREIKGRKFRHASHLTALGAGDLDVEKAAAECAACHDAVGSSKSLATVSQAHGGTVPVNLDSCAGCHGGAPKVLTAPDPARREVRDMFHAAHLATGPDRPASLAQGCLSCHSLADDGATMTLATDGIRDCTECHTGHMNIGQDSCAACHVDADRLRPDSAPSWMCEPHAFSPVERVKKGVRRYSHFSRGHDGVACDVCHTGPAAVEAHDKLSTIRRPEYDDPACVKCHSVFMYHR